MEQKRAIVAWVDTRNGNNDVFAQQVDGNGTVQWLTNGIPRCTVSGNQNYPVIVSDGAGGAILCLVGYAQRRFQYLCAAD